MSARNAVLHSPALPLPYHVIYRVAVADVSNFIMKCDKRTQNIESSVRMTVQKE